MRRGRDIRKIAGRLNGTCGDNWRHHNGMAGKGSENTSLLRRGHGWRHLDNIMQKLALYERSNAYIIINHPQCRGGS